MTNCSLVVSNKWKKKTISDIFAIIQLPDTT
jgi:hypothetical protein